MVTVKCIVLLMMAAPLHARIPEVIRRKLLVSPSLDSGRVEGLWTRLAICQTNADCAQLSHTECVSGRCECATGYYSSTDAPGVCKEASSLGQPCSAPVSPSSPLAHPALPSFPPCRPTLECRQSACACPHAMLPAGGGCVHSCPVGEVLIEEQGCVAVRSLGEECSHEAQCDRAFSECRGGVCVCVLGMVAEAGECTSPPNCPLGPAPLVDGGVIGCDRSEEDQCPSGMHCQFASHKDQLGYCCNTLVARCPSGSPLHSSDCSTCPWDTHHCFSFHIGARQHSMCCPNACHRSTPIRHAGRCLPLSVPGGSCEVDEQCGGEDERCTDRVCSCVAGLVRKEGHCVKVTRSVLGEVCSQDGDCAAGLQLRCRVQVGPTPLDRVESRCECQHGHIKGRGEQCVPEPTCPSGSGELRRFSGVYRDCSNNGRCAMGDYCRTWWLDGEDRYSVCCPKPGATEFSAVCGRYGLSLVLGNSIDALAKPMRCGLSPIESHEECPDGALCVFDPFSERPAEGICCRSIPRS